jgi:hypothetical protein
MIKVVHRNGPEPSVTRSSVAVWDLVLPKPRRHTREGMIMKEAETVANLAYAISEGVHDFVSKAVR